jgi:hypothetical protein
MRLCCCLVLQVHADTSAAADSRQAGPHRPDQQSGRLHRGRLRGFETLMYFNIHRYKTAHYACDFVIHGGVALHRHAACASLPYIVVIHGLVARQELVWLVDWSNKVCRLSGARPGVLTGAALDDCSQ